MANGSMHEHVKTVQPVGHAELKAGEIDGLIRS
jgi:hypothetical protein